MTFVVSITCVIVSSVIRVRRLFNVSFLAPLHKAANIKLPTTPEEMCIRDRFNILGLEITVFHRPNDVTTAGIIAPPLGQHHIQS